MTIKKSQERLFCYEEETNMKIRLDLDSNPTISDIDVIQKGINKFNNEKMGENEKEFCIYLRDESDVIHGGLFAVSYSESIHIILMWMEDELRGKGYGTKLIKAAEEEGIKRNCLYSCVDTFSFQAEGFYRKCGYQPIGIVHHALLNHSRIFLKKYLFPKHKDPNHISKIELIEPSAAVTTCRSITQDLPEYFGIAEANERYAKGTIERTSFAAKVGKEYVGLLTLEFPFSHNANIYWMAVKRQYQGKGIGASLIKAAEEYCYERCCDSITVETLSAKNEDQNYLKTYRFYENVGFKPLFEMNTYGPDFLMVYMQKII
jgi:GNAT superfamily N-acetyltransferase